MLAGQQAAWGPDVGMAPAPAPRTTPSYRATRIPGLQHAKHVKTGRVYLYHRPVGCTDRLPSRPLGNECRSATPAVVLGAVPVFPAVRHPPPTPVSKDRGLDLYSVLCSLQVHSATARKWQTLVALLVHFRCPLVCAACMYVITALYGRLCKPPGSHNLKLYSISCP